MRATPARGDMRVSNAMIIFPMVFILEIHFSWRLFAAKIHNILFFQVYQSNSKTIMFTFDKKMINQGLILCNIVHLLYVIQRKIIKKMFFYIYGVGMNRKKNVSLYRIRECTSIPHHVKKTNLNKKKQKVNNSFCFSVLQVVRDGQLAEKK